MMSAFQPSAFAGTWLILTMYVPLLWLTLALFVWRLATQPRSAEP